MHWQCNESVNISSEFIKSWICQVDEISVKFCSCYFTGSNVTMQEDHEVTFACEKDIK